MNSIVNKGKRLNSKVSVFPSEIFNPYAKTKDNLLEYKLAKKMLGALVPSIFAINYLLKEPI